MPTKAPSWGRVWLGELGTPEEDGYLPVDGPLRTSNLAVFVRKTTIGDATLDSDDYISTWVVSDLTGGQGIDNANAAADVNRFWFGTVDTRWRNQLALPPLVAESAPSGATGSCLPLGDVPSATGAPATFYGAWGATPYGWNAGSSAWYAAATALGATPATPGVRYKGTGSYAYLFVALGAYGIAKLRETAPGTLSVTNVAASSSVPGATLISQHDTRLFAIDSAGVTWVTGDGTAWAKILRPEADASNNDLPLTFDLSETPRRLVSYLNRQGDPTLCLVTDRALWMLSEDANTWVRTNIVSNHPDFGIDAEVWRPGEDIWMAQGPDLLRLTNAFVEVPFSGLARDDGLPPGFRGRVVALAGEAGNLWCATEPSPSATATATEATFMEDVGLDLDDPIVLADDDTRSVVAAWQGTGWHVLWAAANSAFVPTRMLVSVLGRAAHKVWWGGNDGIMRSLPLKFDFMPPKQAREIGVDAFAETASLETGWFDAGMLPFKKVAARVDVDMEHATATETVTVSYKADTDDDWTALGTVAAVGVTSLPFNVATDTDGNAFGKGVSFRRVRFRLDFSRGETVTTSPICKSVNLLYLKVPQNTKSFLFTVPLPPRKWQGKSPQEIIDHLESLVDSDELLKFVHRRRVWRVRVAGLNGTEATGRNEAGAQNVSLIGIPANLRNEGNA